jgi:deoxyadenosine/deoxycytidine kinase
VIYLKKSVPNLLDYIQKRGRAYEKNMEPAYIERLNTLYDEWIASHKEGKVLTIDSNNIDFVAEPAHFQDISRRVLEALDQKELFRRPLP